MRDLSTKNTTVLKDATRVATKKHPLLKRDTKMRDSISSPLLPQDQALDSFPFRNSRRLMVRLSCSAWSCFLLDVSSVVSRAILAKSSSPIAATASGEKINGSRRSKCRSRTWRQTLSTKVFKATCDYGQHSNIASETALLCSTHSIRTAPRCKLVRPC